MPSLTITDSPDIEKLDSKIVASLCDEKFYVDVTPSVWLPGGQGYVEGAKIKIVNPLGAAIKDYSTSVYDIEPPMDDVFEYGIPKTGGVFMYGTYKISVQLTDSEGTKYEVTKLVNICSPDKKNKNKNTGSLGATIKIDCNAGKTVVMLNGVPTYNGKAVALQENDLTLSYPTESGLDPLETTVASFSVAAYEGEYKLSGTVCASYDGGDNVFYDVLYDVKSSKMARCSVDVCCIYAQVDALNKKLETDCSSQEKEETNSKIFDTLRLLNTIEIAAQCGEDFSEYVIELEKLLGCSCSCNCEDGAAISKAPPSSDIVITENCMVSKEVTGNTTTYEIVPVPTVLISTDDLLDIRDPVFNAELCQWEQRVKVLGGGDGGSGGGGTPLSCTSLNDMFDDASAPQKNGVNPSTYRFLGSNCENFSAPTGFAVTGAAKTSAFGKMEWYPNLVAANTAAVAGETVLIYQNTSENLAVKANVHYEGIGMHSVGNLTGNNATSTSHLSNLVIGNITLTSGDNIIATNVYVTGTTNINGTSVWNGGRFIPTGISDIIINGAGARMSYIQAYARVVVYNGALTHSLVVDRTVYSSLHSAIFVNNTEGVENSKALVSHCYAESVNNIGIFAITRDTNTGLTVVSNNVTRSVDREGLYIHFGGVTETTSTVVANNTAYNTGPGAAIKIYDMSGLATGVKTTNHSNIYGNTGYSESGPGIHLILGNIRGCSGYSKSSQGILISSQELQGTNLYVIDCVGESELSHGLLAERDIYVTGGTYISRVTGTAGAPIKITDTAQNSTSPNNYFIAGVKTIAYATTAFAIDSFGDAVTARITGCIFLCEKTAGTVKGINHVGVGGSITLVPVVVDAYLNVT